MTPSAGTISDCLRRRAFTLVEMLLTLCILAVLATLCWPAVNRMLDAQRLASGAQQVRNRWYQARVKAIDSGVTYVFQYALGGADYRVQPLAAESSADADALDADSDAPPSTAASATRSLPEGVAFTCAELAGGNPLSAATSSQSEPVAPVQWSEPILFYCDGTSTSAKVMLVNRRGRTIEVALRGLTSVATIGEVSQLEGGTP